MAGDEVAIPEVVAGAGLHWMLGMGVVERVPDKPGYIRLTPTGRRLRGGGPPTRPARAIGLIRVRYPAPDAGHESLDRLERRVIKAALREGVELVGVVFEVGVFDTAPMAARRSARAAVWAIEEGHASVLLALAPIGDLENSVERAGGRLVLVDTS
jgi:hypothetical protein